MDIIRRKPTANPPQQTIRVQKPAPSGPTKKIQGDTLFITQKDIAAISQAEKRYQRGLVIKRILKILVTLFLLTLLATGAFLGWKIYKTSKKINIDPTKQSSFTQDMGSVLGAILPSKRSATLEGEKEGRINILLLGAAGEKKPGQNLTDTIMVLSIDTQNKKMALLSLPRDLYVKVPGNSYFGKINGLYQQGLARSAGTADIQKVVTDVTGLPIHYYLVMNFDGFTKLINDISGVNVTVERDIYDARYPGPNYSYQTFELKKGFHTLDGETALKYVRERHDDPQGDFGRAKRQQQVIQAVKNKLFSAQTLLNVPALTRLLDTLGNNIQTNISLDEIEGFLALSREVDTQNINNVVVDAWQKDSLLKVSHVQVGPVRAFILIPRIGSYSEIQEVAANIFDQTTIKKRKEQLASEKASITIINQSSDNSLDNRIYKLLKEKLGFEKVQILGATKETTREKTLVFDSTQNRKIYSLDELLKKIPATLASENETLGKPQEDSDFTVFLGNDIIDTYNYDEDSVEEYNKAQDEQTDFNFSAENLK